MKILYVTASLPYGPGEAFVIAEISELLRQGHQVRVVPTWGRGAIVHEDARALERLTEEASLVSLSIAVEAVIAAATAPIRTARLVRSIAPSRNALILAKNAAVVPKALWLARRLRRLGIEHVHAHWGGASSSLAMLAAEASGVSWSMTLHRWDIAEDNLLATKLSRACFVRTISLSGFEKARRHCPDPGDKLIVLPVGVRSVPAQPAARTASAARVLMAANFVPVKAHRVLLKAAAVLSQRGVEFRLDLAGEGPLLATIVEQARDLGLDGSVRFLGQLSHSELLQRLTRHEWDVIVLSSVETSDGEEEGIPVILMEAMAASIPVIAPRIGGIPELLADGAGLLVEQGDVPGLADAIESLLRDEDVRVQFAEAGRRRIAESFAVEQVAGSLAAHFRSCAAPLA